MSALEGTGILGTAGRENYFSFLARKPNEGKIPNPSEMILGSEHVYVIDSRQRNKKYYPSPSKYVINIGTPFKNVTSIELKGSLIPKTEYNVNSENRNIPFNVQDYVTAVKILYSGFGYVDGIYGSGAVPPNDAMVEITDPAIPGGTKAEVTVTVSGNQITNIVIANKGTGYLRGTYGGTDYPNDGFYLNAGASFINNIPKDASLRSRWKDAKIEIVIGNEIIAKLRKGQYDFANPDDSDLGLCAEVTLAMQTATQAAIDAGIIVPAPGGPSTGVEYFPTGTASDGSCFLSTANPNASANNRVNIQRGKPDNSYNQNYFLELLFGSSSCGSSVAVNLLGYGSSVVEMYQKFTPMDQTSFSNDSCTDVTFSSTPVTGRNDWNLGDSPKYVILEITPLQESRITSEHPQLAKGFATLAFDANLPDVVFTSPSDSEPGDGNSGYTSLLAKPGILKGIKGQDFDSKILNFGPAPVAVVSEFLIEFKKFNEDYYDFQGQDHLLIFNIGANDINSGNRF